MARVADKNNKEKVMFFCVVIMCAATGGICLIPTYENWGIASLFMLLLMRLAQGASVSGEFIVAIVYLGDCANRKSIAKFSCLAFVSGMIGLILAILVSAICSSLYDKLEVDFIWRMPFLIGGVASIFLFFIRRNILRDLSLVGGIVGKSIDKKNSAISTIFVSALSAACFYSVVMYVPTKVILFNGFSHAEFMLTMVPNLLFYTLIMFIAAVFGDQYCYKKIMLLSAACLVLFSPYFIWYIHEARTISEIKNIIMIYLIPISVYNGLLPKYLFENSPQINKATFLSLSYNLSLVIFGGFFPAVFVNKVVA